MPGPEPPQDFLDEALMAGVPREQAASTWKHYWRAGLPEHGVEKLYPWLIAQAIEYMNRKNKLPRSANSQAPREQDDPGTRGYERIVPQGEHRRFAARHGLKLEEFVDRINRDPRTKKLSTLEAWGALSRLLEKAAQQHERIGGAA